MKPYSGRDGGHNAGYHSANALLGMIHGITRLIELVASRKFSGKRIPRSKPRFIALPPGDILWQFIWSIVLTISFLNYLVGPIEFGKRPYQHGLGRISYIKQFVLPLNSLCQGMCVVFDSVSEVTRTVLIEVDRAGNGGKPGQKYQDKLGPPAIVSNSSSTSHVPSKTYINMFFISSILNWYREDPQSSLAMLMLTVLMKLTRKFMQHREAFLVHTINGLDIPNLLKAFHKVGDLAD